MPLKVRWLLINLATYKYQRSNSEEEIQWIKTHKVSFKNKTAGWGLGMVVVLDLHLDFE